ncbi:MAG: glycosyltransferase family 4 protein [Ktedonobacteraceae bacterium]|nr:glycosyltransferase family 4 protein [Ktedonobacteraceae bacterium]
MKEHMRICLVSFMFAPLVGGAEVRAEKQARQFQALGQDVMIVTLRHNKEWKRRETLDNLLIIRVGGIYDRKGWLRLGKYGHLPIDVLLFLQLWQLRHQYDLLHVCQLGTIAAVVALVGKITSKPVVVSVPTSGADERQQAASLMADTLNLDSDFLKVDFREAMAGDVAYIAQSALGGAAMIEFLRKSDTFYHILSSRSLAYLTLHGFRAEQVTHIPNGVDTEKFRPVAQRRPDVRRPERDILCVTRLQYPKGVDVLLHAWARLMHTPAEWRAQLKLRLLIVGEGPLRPQLERIVAEHGIQDSVEFLGLRRDVVNLLQEAWGFVLPSRWEGMPNALLEAMACGLPCIATRVSGSEDIINDGVNGLLVPPLQPAELAQALRRIIENPDFAQQLAREGRATIIRDYELKSIAERLLKFYQYLLKSVEE